MTPAIEEKREAVADLCHRLDVERLHVFGSAASDRFDTEASDLDFLVEFRRSDTMTLADQYFGLLSALEELFDREVDLVTAGSLRNPYFVRSIEATRRLLYAA